MTEYNFRHQTKMMSIELGGRAWQNIVRRIDAEFYSLFRELAAQPASSDARSVRLTGYFSHETLLECAAAGGVR
jgi:hypothetical protein